MKVPKVPKKIQREMKSLEKELQNAVGDTVEPMTKTTEWEKRFDARKRLISEHMGGFYKDQYSVNWDIVKDFICKEIESARREVMDEVEKLPRYANGVTTIKTVNGKTWIDKEDNQLVRLNDVLSTLRKEEKV